MKIYIASSWKNEMYLLGLVENLRNFGHKVDCFVDTSSGRFVFNCQDLIDRSGELNAISFLEDERTQKAFKEDKKWLDWCDLCLLVLPSGKSAHLEAGYAKGRDKKLIIYHRNFCGFPKGEFDVMYGFADFMTDKSWELIEYLNTNHSCWAFDNLDGED